MIMIFAAFAADARAKINENLRFRGKAISFWQREIFQELEFLEPEEIDSQRDFNFLILFDPSAFLKMEPEGFREILEYLEKQDPQKEIVLTLKGHPLFIVSNCTFKRLNPDLKNDDDLITRLSKEKNLELIDLKNSYKTLDLLKDSQQIESVIVNYQILSLLHQGAVIEDFNSFYMEGMVPIGEGSILSSGVVLKGKTRIGKNVVIYPHSYIEDSTIGDGCTILPGCIIRDSRLEQDVHIGPYTHLRKGAVVKKGARMGNFVEMKTSVLGDESKAMHLSYIGDAEIGKRVNIGAGTITCNYDGKNKNKTIIEDNVFIGSGTELVAPVTIKKNSYVAAGSTITENVPQDSLGVARQKQRNIIDWVKKKRR